MAYLSKYGLGEADLAEVPVAQSRWSSCNPRAFRSKLLTVDEVLAWPLIAWPFHQLECCPVNDGGGALVQLRLSEAPIWTCATVPSR